MRFKAKNSVPVHKVTETKSKHYIFISFLCVLACEIAEIIIENLIITGISYLLLKIITTLFAVAGVHAIRVLLKTLVTKIIYREGTDKMEKLKEIFKWIFANKKSLSSTVVNAVISGAGITASWAISDLPQIMVAEFNIAPILYTAIFAVCFILNELGICGKGFEAVQQFVDRKEQEKLEKEAHAQIKADEAEKMAIEKAAQAQLKAEEKALQAQIKAEEKAKAESEYAAKIEAKKAEILQQKAQ